ncbi:hypothetical protein DL766_003246 [Monosporascus sp. MC13-8B]|uniref:Uncharacterized protein n=1 Tax=Monosporascus cannonballus TaxID=155416 RepID=A0ABY0HI13_9PEZI|nr:hypothetical protein DL762_001317 [Monosporascus cannonballus]RYP01644.1 hypothetical protein DL763_000033 [Monosporascus cannonballus]RYP33877.1 hypothetical protein DL766_003246 [Monosporascus sp. MC13-8B]
MAATSLLFYPNIRRFHSEHASMLSKSVAVTASLAASASAQLSPGNTTRSCGTPLPTEAPIQASQQML